MQLHGSNIFLVILSLFTSCSSPSTTDEPSRPEQGNPTLDETYAIINQEFLHIVDTSWYYEPLPIPPVPPPPDIIGDSSTMNTARSYDYEAYNREVKEWKQRLEERKRDTSRLIVVISDTLYPVAQRYLNNKYWSQKENFKRDFCNDTAFIGLVEKLNGFTKPQSFSHESITKVGKYEIMSPSNFKMLKGNYRKICSLSFSRFAFNEDVTKACFYYSVLFAPLNGEGVILMLEKAGDQWKVVCSRVLSVA